jgi:polysaccharide biosynthesis protein PslH
MGKAVVSTHIGAEGLPFAQGTELLLEDKPDRFAASVTKLLNDKVFRRQIGLAAQNRVVRDHSWESVTDQMERILLAVRNGQNALSNEIPLSQMASLPEA